MTLRNLLGGVGPFLALALLAGCGGGSGLVEVTGTLTHKGVPIKYATVMFSPDGGRPSQANTDEQGRFKLRYDRERDGVEIGTHTVSIAYNPQTPKEREDIEIHGKPPPVSKELKAVFDKYSFANSKHKMKIESSTRDLKVELN